MVSLDGFDVLILGSACLGRASPGPLHSPPSPAGYTGLFIVLLTRHGRKSAENANVSAVVGVVRQCATPKLGSEKSHPLFNGVFFKGGCIICKVQ